MSLRARARISVRLSSLLPIVQLAATASRAALRPSRAIGSKGFGAYEETGDEQDSLSWCQSYSLRVLFTAARLTGATAHHHQRGGRRWQVNHRACAAAVHAVWRPDRRR